MKRSEVVNIFAKKRTEEIVLTNIALVSRQVYAACHTDMTLYRIQMGYPLPMGIGLALALPQRRVIVLDGDGSLLLGLGALGLPAPAAGRGAWAATARPAGVENSVTCSTAAEFQRALDGALAREGLFCIVAKVERTAPEEEKIPTLPFDLTENTYMFLRALTEAGLIKGWREGFSRPLRTTK